MRGSYVQNKPEKGHLSSAFRKAFLTGMTALTLAAGVSSKVSAQSSQAAPKDTAITTVHDTTAAQLDPKPWQKDPDYIKQMENLRKAYELNVKASERQVEAVKAQYPDADNGETNPSVLGKIIRAGRDPQHVAALERARAQAQERESQLLLNYDRQQEYLDQRFRNQYERDHPKYRVPEVVSNFENQKREVCQRRELQALSQGRELPPGDACRNLLNKGPQKP